jgi:NADP-dependent 3-hydroxy acid dehydrogenase YdfG
MTRALLPRLIESGAGHVVAVTSIAGFESYRGGAGYIAAKHAQRSLLRNLRLELLGRPVRVTEIAPGWSRPSSPWSASTATSRRPAGCTKEWSRCAPRT